MADKILYTRTTFEDLQGAMENIDWEAHRRKVEWGLSEPFCSCNRHYNSWLEWGKEPYENNPQTYEKRKREALIHLESKKAGRELDRQKREKRERAYSAA